MGKPIPEITGVSSTYWLAAKEDRYILQKCEKCDGYNSYPRERCMHCWSTKLTWVSTAGIGEIITFSIIHQPPSPAWETPYVLAVVKLEEGVQVMSNILGIDSSEVKIGMKVQIVFENRGDFKIPQFTPIT